MTILAVLEHILCTFHHSLCSKMAMFEGLAGDSFGVQNLLAKIQYYNYTARYAYCDGTITGRLQHFWPVIICDCMELVCLGKTGHKLWSHKGGGGSPNLVT